MPAFCQKQEGAGFNARQKLAKRMQAVLDNLVDLMSQLSSWDDAGLPAPRQRSTELQEIKVVSDIISGDP